MKLSSSLWLSKVGGRERSIPNEGNKLFKVPKVRKRSSFLTEKSLESKGNTKVPRAWWLVGFTTVLWAELCLS